MASTPFQILAANLADPRHRDAIVELLEMYAREPTGAGGPLATDVRERLLPGLESQPNGRHFLAFDDRQPIGIAICFFGFSTFHARPLLNIHDLAVSPDYRGRGVGRELLTAIEQAARDAGCCKLTLEVRADNHGAQNLYRTFGFAAGDDEASAMAFWTKRF